MGFRDYWRWRWREARSQGLLGIFGLLLWLLMLGWTAHEWSRSKQMLALVQSPFFLAAVVVLVATTECENYMRYRLDRAGLSSMKSRVFKMRGGALLNEYQRIHGRDPFFYLYQWRFAFMFFFLVAVFRAFNAGR